MAFRDDYDFDLLVNEAENLVLDELEKNLSEIDNICKCQECILDMATFALNKIEPKYRSSYIGQIYAQQYHSGQYKDEIVKAVKSAISKISKNPAHDLSSSKK